MVDLESEWLFGIGGLVAAWWFGFLSRTGRTINPWTASISDERASDLFDESTARWHPQAATAEQLTAEHSKTPVVPADLILATIAHESAGQPGADHANGEHGLGGFTTTATKDVVQNTPSGDHPKLTRLTEEIGNSYDPAQWSNAQEIYAIGVYLGLLYRRQGTWLKALEAYRCGPDRTAPSGDCRAEALARLRQVGRAEDYE